MAVTTTSFKEAFPEFAKAGTPMLEARLAHAEQLVSTDAYGDRRDQVVMLTLADLLATSPSGRDAQLEASQQPGPTTYRRQLWRLQQAMGCAASARLGTTEDLP